MSPILITSYTNPDLDGVASAIAYSEFLQKAGRDAVVRFMGEPQQEAEYMLDRFGVARPEIIPNAENFTQVILVDASNPKDLRGAIEAEKVIEVIDHRAIHQADAFPNAVTDIEMVGAAATLVAEKFMHDKVEITPSSAALLYGAIISNTLNFQGSMTTNRDREAADWLNEIAKLPNDFWREQFEAKSDLSGEKLKKRIEDDFVWFIFGEKKIGIAQLELMGARKLLSERGNEIVQILDNIKERLSLDFVFQNTIELERAASFLVAPDGHAQKILATVFGVSFDGVIAELPQPLMRKQLVKSLKEALG